jgi:hypothetical protein
MNTMPMPKTMQPAQPLEVTHEQIEVGPDLLAEGIASRFAVFFVRTTIVLVYGEDGIIGNGSASAWPGGPCNRDRGIEMATARAVRNLQRARAHNSDYWRRRAERAARVT